MRAGGAGQGLVAPTIAISSLQGEGEGGKRRGMSKIHRRGDEQKIPSQILAGR